MGGFGSGRRFGKDCTDDMQALDVRKLQRQRLLTPGNSLTWSWSVNGDTCATINLLVGADRVTLNYRTRERGGDWRPVNYPVRLDWTACNYGGRRAWWLCPAASCGRRVAVLYGGAVFACRHCHRLAYRCQRETDDDRAARLATMARGANQHAQICAPSQSDAAELLNVSTRSVAPDDTNAYTYLSTYTAASAGVAKCKKQSATSG